MIEPPQRPERGPAGPSLPTRSQLVWPYQTLPESSNDGAAAWPFDPREYLDERYAKRGRLAGVLRAFYALRPLIPRRLQLHLRRLFSRLQRSRAFPAWPIEPVLVEGQYEHLRRRVRSSGEPLPFVNFWPNGRRFAAVLTHDVESERGLEAIPALLEIEQRHGFTSSWNFCAEEYPIPPWLFDDLRAAGCEVGLHGIKHDGKLFASRASFEASLPKIHHYLREWHVDGFRSPATHRNADWMPELGCLYDSSFPDTDPFEPMAGGCCSIFPFFNGDLVELPITLVQDHTLFAILGGRSIAPWTSKSEWIIRHHGLINLIVHPDYALSPDRLAHYDRFLAFLRAQPGGWHANPAEVARWWRIRAGLGLDALEREPANGEPASLQPTLALAREDDGAIGFELVTRSDRFVHAPVPQEAAPNRAPRTP